MSEVYEPLVTSNYNHGEALRLVRLAERDFENETLRIANIAAEALHAEGGTTRDLGRFSLAMFGYDQNVGIAPEVTSEYLNDLNDTIGYQRFNPVATYTSFLGTPVLHRLGWAAGDLDREEPSALSYSVKKQKYDSRFNASVQLDLRDVHSLTADGKIRRDKGHTLTLGHSDRTVDYLATKLDTRNDFQIGWSNIISILNFGIDQAIDVGNLKLLSATRTHFTHK